MSDEKNPKTEEVILPTPLVDDAEDDLIDDDEDDDDSDEGDSD